MTLNEILRLAKKEFASIRLCAFDFDSTLMDGETIDLLAKAYGVGDEVAKITHRAMSGELDFFESLSERVRLLKGMPCELVEQVCENLPLMKGANELISYLKSRKIHTLVMSGGFHEGIDKAQKKLGFDLGFANFLHAKNGVLTGLVGGEIMQGDSKGVLLARIRGFLRLSKADIMCVGDGANDLAMFAESGLKIAFCAKPILRANADVCIDSKDLSLIIKELQ